MENAQKNNISSDIYSGFVGNIIENTELRKQIDELDEQLLELLSKRMEITNEIGIYKKQHNMPVLQTGRYNEIISRLVSRCAGTGLDPDFIKKIFETIHSQSVANQLKL